MRKLFAVALSEDGTSVVLATSPDAQDGRFSVAVDDRLQAAVRGELDRVAEPGPTRESAVTPREIQARLRTGESIEQIAADAGVDAARVERFAGPVLSERTQVIDSARAATLVWGRRGPSAVPLGVAVDRQLATLAGVRVETAVWSTVRQVEGTWLVQVTFTARDRDKTCRWRYDPLARKVTAENPPSADLGHLDTVPSRAAWNPPPTVVVDPGPELLAASRGRAVKAPKARAASAAKVVGTPKVEAVPESEAALTTGQLAALRVVPEPAASTSTTPGASTHDHDEVVGADRAAVADDRAEPDHRSDPPEPTPRKTTRPARTGKRASVPAWADVLLSTSAADEQAADRRGGSAAAGQDGSTG